MFLSATLLSLSSNPLLLSSSVQWVFSRCPSDLAKGEAEGLRWGSIPTSCSSGWRSDPAPVLQPERLQVLSSHIHLRWASCWQVPLGQQIPILERAREIGLLLVTAAMMPNQSTIDPVCGGGGGGSFRTVYASLKDKSLLFVHDLKCLKLCCLSMFLNFEILKYFK